MQPDECDPVVTVHRSPPLVLLRLLARRYDLKDVIIGKIYFILVRIKIKHMELQVLRREASGAGIVGSRFYHVPVIGL